MALYKFTDTRYSQESASVSDEPSWECGQIPFVVGNEKEAYAAAIISDQDLPLDQMDFLTSLSIEELQGIAVKSDTEVEFGNVYGYGA